MTMDTITACRKLSIDPLWQADMQPKFICPQLSHSVGIGLLGMREISCLWEISARRFVDCAYSFATSSVVQIAGQG